MVKKYGPWSMYRSALATLFLATVIGKALFQRPHFSISAGEVVVLVVAALIIAFVEYAIEIGKIAQAESKKEAAVADKRHHTSVQRSHPRSGV